MNPEHNFCEHHHHLFFSSRRRHTRYWRDWSSYVCFSDLVSHGSGGSKTIMAFIPAAAASATAPSMISLRGGGSRTALARLITSGATVMMPTASDANQCCQMVQIGAVGLWNNSKATVPPIAEAPVATTSAASSPSILRSLSRPKLEPK